MHEAGRKVKHRYVVSSLGNMTGENTTLVSLSPLSDRLGG